MKKIFLILALGLLVAGCNPRQESNAHSNHIIRVGFFPNITHAQALVAQCMERRGNHLFLKHFPANTKIEWFSYNAGPSAMEAVLTSSIDLSYVGPNPALNAYMRSRGEEIRYISNAARGGAALVVQQEIQTPLDLIHKRIATPQLGNTQDIACRRWLKDQGLQVSLNGGDCEVAPIANPDQLGLFAQGEIAGAWTVEPWVSRILYEIKTSKILVEQKDAVTTILISRRRYLQENENTVKAFLEAHRELTLWINEHPQEAQEMVIDQLNLLMHGKISPEIVRSAWKRLQFDDAYDINAMQTIVDNARDVGFIQNEVSLDKFFVPLTP